ncbi:MAG: transketolase, partial [Verrucomicrobia bacterium]
PLGQGVGNAVGMAMSAKMAEARFNTEKHPIFDYKVVCLMGDGCMQEGVSQEASALAGHLGLDNLILIFDSNDVTLDAPGEASQSDDTAARYRSIGFDVLTVDGHNLEALAVAYDSARNARSGRPQLIIARTEIGRGIPEVAGTSKAHGEGGAKFADSAKAALGIPVGETFHVSDDVRAYFGRRVEEHARRQAEWDGLFEAWKVTNPDKSKLLEDGYARKIPDADTLLSWIPEADEKPTATRVSGGKALNALAAKLPLIISGSADLHGSTKNYLENADGDFTRENRLGRNIRFGIREHAMGAIVNGIAYEGLFMASGATFFTFSDYMRPSVRLSALASLPVMWYWTHDSVGVGVDGPTHQPVETISGLRCVPNLDMIRPADAEESAGAIVAAIERTDGPTGLSLTRQNVPALSEIPVESRRHGTLKGGYIARMESGDLQAILLASGSELQMALKAADSLGNGIRVVSMPCFERFDRQPADYRETVLPTACRNRVAVEAGVPHTWYQYVGLDGEVIGINDFGLSAPGDQVMEALGCTVDAVIGAVKKLIG